jgi:hypothetical protein
MAEVFPERGRGWGQSEETQKFLRWIRYKWGGQKWVYTGDTWLNLRRKEGLAFAQSPRVELWIYGAPCTVLHHHCSYLHKGLFSLKPSYMKKKIYFSFLHFSKNHEFKLDVLRYGKHLRPLVRDPLNYYLVLETCIGFCLFIFCQKIWPFLPG